MQLDAVARVARMHACMRCAVGWGGVTNGGGGRPGVAGRGMSACVPQRVRPQLGACAWVAVHHVATRVLVFSPAEATAGSVCWLRRAACILLQFSLQLPRDASHHNLSHAVYACRWRLGGRKPGSFKTGRLNSDCWALQHIRANDRSLTT